MSVERSSHSGDRSTPAVLATALQLTIGPQRNDPGRTESIDEYPPPQPSSDVDLTKRLLALCAFIQCDDRFKP